VCNPGGWIVPNPFACCTLGQLRRDNQASHCNLPYCCVRGRDSRLPRFYVTDLPSFRSVLACAQEESCRNRLFCLNPMLAIRHRRMLRSWGRVMTPPSTSVQSSRRTISTRCWTEIIAFRFPSFLSRARKELGRRQ
jgi:hypothetical protein